MERTLILSIGVSAAIHAGLLFGITPGKAPAFAKPAVSTTRLIDIKVLPEPQFDPERTDEVSDEISRNTGDLWVPPPLEPDISIGCGTGIDWRTVAGIGVGGPIGKVVAEMTGTLRDLPSGPGLGTDEVVRSEELDRAPRVRSQVAPGCFFETNRLSSVETVTVEFVVDERGRVLNSRVKQSTNPILNGPAVRAVAQWTFEPGRRNGRVVRFKMAVPIVFSANDSE